ncbi:coil containing protein [Vibrio phage vB_VpS_PG28]|nr:coil containing protein [Vibrio phage vB_VpS_PG28]
MALRVLGVPKVKNGKAIEEGSPAYPADNIAATNKHMLKRSNATLKKQRENRGVSEEEAQRRRDHALSMNKKSREKSAQNRAEKLQELEDLRQAGITPMPDEATNLSTEDRRREVYKLHLRGFNNTLISGVFGVSRVTITEDLKVMKTKIIEELTSLGAEGLVTRSYSMYELLQHEAIKYLDNLPNGAIKDGIALIRLAKDLEDSKTRLLSSIGAIRSAKIKGAESIVQGNTSGAPMVQTTDMMSVLNRIQQRMQAEGAEDAEVTDVTG